MSLPPPDLATAKGLVSIPHGFALLITLFRSFERWRMGRLWYDDYWAMIALTFDVPNWVVFLIRPPSGSGEQFFSIRSRVIIYWISLVCFPLTVWCARISIGVSAVRILPPGATMRKLAFGMNVLLGFMCMGLLIYRIYNCGHTSAWHDNPGVQCFLPRGVGIYNLVADVIADVMLIAVPLKMLWNVKLPFNLRPIVLAIFAASIFTSLSSVVYVVFLFGARGWGPGLGLLVAITSHLEATTALIVCNLLVLITYFYRVYRNGQDIESYYPSSTATSLPSHELQTQRITGIPRGSTIGRRIDTDRAQTITASVAFTEVTEEGYTGSSQFYDSAATNGTRSTEKSTRLGPVTQ